MVIVHNPGNGWRMWLPVQKTDIYRAARNAADSTGKKQEILRKVDGGWEHLETIYPDPTRATAGMSEQEADAYLAKMDRPGEAAT